MHDRMPQQEVDREFARIASFSDVTTLRPAEESSPDPDIPTLNDHYRHLKGQAYTDSEIVEIFGLVHEDGRTYEV